MRQKLYTKKFLSLNIVNLFPGEGFYIQSKLDKNLKIFNKKISVTSE